MNLPSLNQMTSKVPKCVRPWRLIPNEGLLTDRKCLHVTSQVTDGQTRSTHHRLGDNTLFTNLFSVYLLTVPGGKFLLSPFCFWENWSLERADDLTRSHKEVLKEPATLAPFPGPVRTAGLEDTSQAEGHPGLPWVGRAQSCNAHPSQAGWCIQIQALNPQKNSHYKSTHNVSTKPIQMPLKGCQNILHNPQNTPPKMHPRKVSDWPVFHKDQGSSD